MNSTVVPQVQAVFPQGALTKKIKVGLQVRLLKQGCITQWRFVDKDAVGSWYATITLRKLS